MDFGLDLALDAFKLTAIHYAIESLAHHDDGIARLPALDLGGIPVAHAFVVSGSDVTAVPVGLDIDEVRAFAFADCRNHALERPQQELAIVAVERLALPVSAAPDGARSTYARRICCSRRLSA